MKGQISVRSALTLKHDGGFTAAVARQHTYTHVHAAFVVAAGELSFCFSKNVLWVRASNFFHSFVSVLLIQTLWRY